LLKEDAADILNSRDVYITEHILYQTLQVYVQPLWINRTTKMSNVKVIKNRLALSQWTNDDILVSSHTGTGIAQW